MKSVRPKLKTVGRGRVPVTSLGTRSGSKVGRVMGEDLMRESEGAKMKSDTYSFTVPAKSAPLRPPLQSTHPTTYPRDQNCYGSFGFNGKENCNMASTGSVQQLDKQLPLLERDRQIALVEEELKLTRRLMEVKRREQEVNEMAIQLEEQRKGNLGGDRQVNTHRLVEKRVEVGTDQDKSNDQVDISEEMFKQIEKARKEELERLSKGKLNEALVTKKDLSSNEVSRSKVKDLLDMQRKELNKPNVSDGQFVKYADGLKMFGNEAPCEVVNADEESDSLGQSSAHNINMGFVYNSTADFASVLGEDIPDQQELWDRIKREEDDGAKSLGQISMVKEQQEILNKIQEENTRRKKEEDLTMKLIAELSLNDQRQQHSVKAVPVRGAEVTALSKIAASLDRERDVGRSRQEVERRHQQKKWDENKNQLWGCFDEKNESSASRGTTFKDILVNGNSRGLNADKKNTYGEMEFGFGARRKDEGIAEHEGDKRKASAELKQKIAEQERKIRARIEKETLEKDWEMATMRKENGFGQLRPGKTEKIKKQK